MALLRTDSGSKVGWQVYDNEAEARQAAVKAREDAIRQAAHGYDFGYCVPGEVTQTRTYPHKTKDGKTDYSRPEFLNEWVVTVP